MTKSSKWGTWYKLPIEREILDLCKQDWFQVIVASLILGYVILNCVE